jgi:hypothetical protein
MSLEEILVIGGLYTKLCANIEHYDATQDEVYTNAINAYIAPIKKRCKWDIDFIITVFGTMATGQTGHVSQHRLGAYTRILATLRLPYYKHLVNWQFAYSRITKSPANRATRRSIARAQQHLQRPRRVY